VLPAGLDALARDPAPSQAVVQAQTDIGPLLLHADDKVVTPFIQQHGSWVPHEGAWLRDVLWPGMHAVDICADVGYFSLLIAHAVGPSRSVLAVEPERENVRLLRLNVWCHGVDHVTVPVAAPARRDAVALRRNAVNRCDYQVRANVAGGDDDDGKLVALVALDVLLGDRPVDVVKVDTRVWTTRWCSGCAACSATLTPSYSSSSGSTP
jgi:FkbM family methyltransferase